MPDQVLKKTLDTRTADGGPRYDPPTSLPTANVICSSLPPISLLAPESGILKYSIVGVALPLPLSIAESSLVSVGFPSATATGNVTGESWKISEESESEGVAEWVGEMEVAALIPTEGGLGLLVVEMLIVESGEECDLGESEGRVGLPV